MILPKHVAIIVDGNRRWAKKQGFSSIVGHKYVTDNTIESLVYRCLELKIPYITFWAFSTENWKRGKKFASTLFKLLEKTLQKNTDKWNKDGIRLNTIGDLSKLPQNLVKTINQRTKESVKNKKITVTLALNYGGRDEIIRAVNKIIKQQCNSVTMKQFDSYLDTHDLPDPDLIIRTGGAKRLSGFMTWQSEYSEFYFTDILMPDFTIKEFNKALQEYSQRQRRYGK